MSEQEGSAVLNPDFFRCTYPVPRQTHPSLSGPDPAESESKAQASSPPSHPKRGKLSCPYPISFSKPIDHPQGGTSTELAEEQAHSAKIYTNRTLSSGRNLHSGKEGSSITLIAYPPVKYIYYSNQKVSID